MEDENEVLFGFYPLTAIFPLAVFVATRIEPCIEDQIWLPHLLGQSGFFKLITSPGISVVLNM
jgi:hypothetical protein